MSDRSCRPPLWQPLDSRSPEMRPLGRTPAASGCSALKQQNQSCGETIARRARCSMISSLLQDIPLVLHDHCQRHEHEP